MKREVVVARKMGTDGAFWNEPNQDVSEDSIYLPHVHSDSAE